VAQATAVGPGHPARLAQRPDHQIHVDSRGIYGAHRVRAELLHGQGIVVGHNAVAMLMQRAGLKGLPNRRVRYRPAGIATAADLVDRRFSRTAPDQLWVTDITEHGTREGKLYCCVVLDAYSRRVVGWSIDSAQSATLATSALGMAISNRTPAEAVFHSDHGVQFTSWAFTDRANPSLSGTILHKAWFYGDAPRQLSPSLSGKVA
jgi:transposase InsO family protein